MYYITFDYMNKPAEFEKAGTPQLEVKTGLNFPMKDINFVKKKLLFKNSNVNKQFLSHYLNHPGISH